ncbi:MAG: hypothetical protein GWP61_07445 [Chloroflexi bacterium]|jgi:hypothetical protein|nr:hypothetical protein [Chloroflexota bacterium]
MIWTRWDANHYMLVDDGTAIWVGTGSGLLRWDKATATHTRISTADGLPHREVLAGAVDSTGNRWFGGDGGLSRLDLAQNWTHYNTANSDIYSNVVDGIAVGADGTLWLSHGSDSYISSLRPDGSWLLYPNRHAAVGLDYTTIKQAINSNYLWAIAGDEVWVGYDVFNGSIWQIRKPAGASSSLTPKVVAADSQNTVWALDSWGQVFSWDGMQWWEWFAPDSLSTLAVGENDEVWVGGSRKPGTPNCCDSYPVFGLLPDEPDDPFSFDTILDTPPPFVALWPTNEGVWGIGPNWLLKPDGKAAMFTDCPYYQDVREAIVDRQGTTWINSSNWSAGVLQVFDDMGTATMSDDQGSILGKLPTITVREPASNGDLWVAWGSRYKQSPGIIGPYPGPPIRYHNGVEIEYQKPQRHAAIDDIFAQDARHTWFAYEIIDFSGGPSPSEKGVYLLDDRGTPADFSDDVWTSYAIDTTGEGGFVAVQNDHLWYGDTSGLYRYTDPGWEQVSTESVVGLVPAADGSLFVDINQALEVWVVEPDGQQYTTRFAKLFAIDLQRVRSTERRNRMWTVAPDGAIWYWSPGYKPELVRRDHNGETVYSTPVKPEYIEVDQNNHVWLADSVLWRMSPQPDFAIGVAPSLWMMSQNNTRNGTVKINSIEGYTEAVQVTVEDLPSGVTAKIDPNPLLAGETAVLTLTTTGAALGNYSLTVSGTSASFQHSGPLELAVVEKVFDMLVPVTSKHFIDD